jgi:hypothetical protein
VTLTCREGQQWSFTLKAQDLAELDWDDGAVLHLERVAPDAKTPAPPHSEPPPLPPDEDARSLTADDKAYFLALQSAVRRHDREWFAEQGGVRVNRGGGVSYTYQPDEVRDVYDWIITPDIERAVLAQQPEKLFRNSHGAMVGNGEVWFDQFWNGKRWVYFIEAVNQASRRRGS